MVTAVFEHGASVPFHAHDWRDKEKQEKAVDPIGWLYEGVLLWQVARVPVGQPQLAPQGYSYTDALAAVTGLRRASRTVLPAWKVLDRAETLKSRRIDLYTKAILTVIALLLFFKYRLTKPGEPLVREK